MRKQLGRVVFHTEDRDIVFQADVNNIYMYSGTSIIHADLTYPAPQLSGLALVQQKFLCACVVGVTVCIQQVHVAISE